jgi:hypothetical protein
MSLLSIRDQISGIPRRGLPLVIRLVDIIERKDGGTGRQWEKR